MRSHFRLRQGILSMHAFSRAVGLVFATTAVALPAAAQGPRSAGCRSTRPAWATRRCSRRSAFPRPTSTGSAPARRDRSTGRTAPTTTSRRRSTRRRRRCSGELRLRYTNNSPDTLRFIWMQMEQNAFKDKSLNSFIFPQDSRFGARGFEGGDVIERFDQLPRARRAGADARSRRASNETVMKVDLAEPLAPGQDRDVRRRVALPHPRARRRPHGTRRLAVRARAVVSARRRLRRRARLEHRALPRPGRVLPRVRRLQRTPSPCRPATSSPARATLTNPREVLTADADRAPRAGGEVGDAGARSSRSTSCRAARRDRRRPARSRGSSAAKNVRDVAWAASPGIHLGRSRAGRASWRTRTTARARSSRGRTRPTRRACRSGILRRAGSSIRGRRSRAVEGPISGMEYPMLAMESEERGQVRPVQRRDARDRAQLVPDDRRLERARAHVAGRGLQHLHQHVLARRAAIRRRATRWRARWASASYVEGAMKAERRRADRDEPRPHRPARCSASRRT